MVFVLGLDAVVLLHHRCVRTFRGLLFAGWFAHNICIMPCFISILFLVCAVLSLRESHRISLNLKGTYE